MLNKLLLFFKDKDGHIAILDWPNIPLAGWMICTVLLHFIKTGSAHAGFSFLGGAFIFLWSYLEITSGKSPFRRVFGAVVMILTVLSHFK